MPYITGGCRQAERRTGVFGDDYDTLDGTGERLYSCG